MLSIDENNLDKSNLVCMLSLFNEKGAISDNLFVKMLCLLSYEKAKLDYSDCKIDYSEVFGLNRKEAEIC